MGRWLFIGIDLAHFPLKMYEWLKCIHALLWQEIFTLNLILHSTMHTIHNRKNFMQRNTNFIYLFFLCSSNRYKCILYIKYLLNTMRRWAFSLRLCGCVVVLVFISQAKIFCCGYSFYEFFLFQEKKPNTKLRILIFRSELIFITIA